ncbi:hypothetical protein B7O87_07510 [Cylindrospermopsis raciborskii CENA303]|uniref:Uncharacterized protein n=2 Tax=Cylindrospermopsis raciborskii TaxID=77022 RepID=A0A1X4G6M2_9CYAN|nr:hypothetical protein BCV64_09570 [Cylindrospermopsis raciborskii MVCC14]OPH10142.1 hypothetical protein CENA302_07035 [Cylindrospermopsis raciborskii CENA302]OSO90666.1 hypothetical protein B7O87_07510 [Cylindrospermopsis raciborskii CENA303]
MATRHCLGTLLRLVSHYSPKLVECGNFSCYWLDQENRGTKIAQDGILDNLQLGESDEFSSSCTRIPRNLTNNLTIVEY